MPFRSSFISGRLPIHVNQQNHPPSSPGGGVPLNMTTIADKLQSVGYSTHQVCWIFLYGTAALLAMHVAAANRLTDCGA